MTRRRGWGRVLRALAVLGVCLPPALAELGRADPVRVMENFSILSSQETWMRLHGGRRDAWIIPSCNGEPRVNKPPMLVWMNLLAWADLTPESATVERLVLRARLLGVVFGLLAVGATAWMGRRLYGEGTGWVAALALGTGLLFLRHARIAAYDIHLLGWLALAMAAAAGALTAGGAASSVRRRLAWGGAGLALGAALLTKGPLAVLLGAGPMAAWIAARPGPRAAAWRGLALAVVVAAAVAAPWYAHVLAAVPDSAGRLFTEYRAQRDRFQPPWYYLGLIALIFPWTFAWLRSLPEAVRRERGGGWNAAWAWFLFVFVVMSIPGAKQQRYILPILPAMALMAARGWLAAPDGRWRRAMDAAHAIMLAAATVLAVAFAASQDLLVARHWIARAPLADLRGAAAAVAGLALAAAAWAAVRALRSGRRMAAAWLTAAWMSMLATAGFAGVSRAGHGADPCRADALAVARAVGDAPLYYVYRHQPDDLPPSKEFLIYTRRAVPTLGKTWLERKLARGDAFFAMARVTPGSEPALEGHGLARVMDFDDGSKRSMRLYRSPAVAAGAGAVNRAAPGSPAAP